MKNLAKKEEEERKILLSIFEKAKINKKEMEDDDEKT